MWERPVFKYKQELGCNTQRQIKRSLKQASTDWYEGLGRTEEGSAVGREACVQVAV